MKFKYMNEIISTIILVVVVFFLSADKKFNKLINNKSIVAVLILITIYFCLNKLDFRIALVVLIGIILYNSDIYKKKKLIETLRFKNKISPTVKVQNTNEEKKEDEIIVPKTLAELQGMFKEIDQQINNK